jgi:hypothetical protein
MNAAPATPCDTAVDPQTTSKRSGLKSIHSYNNKIECLAASIDAKKIRRKALNGNFYKKSRRNSKTSSMTAVVMEPQELRRRWKRLQQNVAMPVTLFHPSACPDTTNPVWSQKFINISYCPLCRPSAYYARRSPLTPPEHRTKRCVTNRTRIFHNRTPTTSSQNQQQLILQQNRTRPHLVRHDSKKCGISEGNLYPTACHKTGIDPASLPPTDSKTKI